MFFFSLTLRRNKSLDPAGGHARNLTFMSSYAGIFKLVTQSSSFSRGGRLRDDSEGHLSI